VQKQIYDISQELINSTSCSVIMLAHEEVTKDNKIRIALGAGQALHGKYNGLWTNVIYAYKTNAGGYFWSGKKMNVADIVPHGAYHSFCGMNAMWRRDAIVLSYHMLMGKKVYGATMTQLPFDRFGDIWCGIIQKKICDHLGWAVSSGTPYIHHDRASNPFTNLRKEANGIEVNEWFWEKIDAIDLSKLTNAASCYFSIGSQISLWGGEHKEYWNMLGNAMMRWAVLFS